MITADDTNFALIKYDESTTTRQLIKYDVSTSTKVKTMGVGAATFVILIRLDNDNQHYLYHSSSGCIIFKLSDLILTV